MRIDRRSALAAATGGALGLAALIAPGAFDLARAQDAPPSPVVVELFTSQGCSSCPPADELLGALTNRADLVPLSFNVDYWDYLGWKDSLANPAYSERQRAYARKHNERTVYTPQVVVAGKVGVVGSRRDEVEAAIAAQGDMPPPATIALSFSGGALVIEIAPTSPMAMPCEIVLAGYQKKVEQPIGRGENAGRTITYYNAVRELRTLGQWSGAETQTFSEPIDPSLDGFAVMLQAGDGGPVLAAARIER